MAHAATGISELYSLIEPHFESTISIVIYCEEILSLQLYLVITHSFIANIIPDASNFPCWIILVPFFFSRIEKFQPE